MSRIQREHGPARRSQTRPVLKAGKVERAKEQKQMRIRLPEAIALTVALAAPAAMSAAAAAVSTLAAWLPDPNTGDAAWRNGQTAVTNQYDYFVCGGVTAPSEGKQSFYYAGSGCPLMKKGTAFTYAPSGKGTVLYDRAHGIVLYDKGCCAERGFALTKNVGAPPKPVGNADLTGVRTKRGVSLNMTQAQVLRIYGSTRSYDVKGRPGATTLSYTTMKTKPNEPGGACAQFQSFSFRQDRLISIELLFAC
jgi:hypothetical protein